MDTICFDDIDDWAPDLSAALRPHIPGCLSETLRAAAPEFVEDARDVLFRMADREAVVDVTLDWLRSIKVAGYHGTRLTESELASVLHAGLVPLKADARRARLVRALSRHPRWHEVGHSIDGIIAAHGRGCAGTRENQVHLTLSKAGLVQGFNHYLTHGAEFDQHVAQALLSDEGKELLASDGQPRLITMAVPGTLALAAAHPYFSLDDFRSRGELPNIVNEFLKAWAYKLAHRDFQCRTLELDCGMIFGQTLRPSWIIEVETLRNRPVIPIVSRAA